jgi:hypothetical protein
MGETNFRRWRNEKSKVTAGDEWDFSGMKIEDGWHSRLYSRWK